MSAPLEKKPFTSLPPIGIDAHIGKPGAAELVSTLAAAFRAAGREVVFLEETARLAKEPHGSIQARPIADLLRCSPIVALGGDGAILYLLRQLVEAGDGRAEKIPPVFGINLGSLGFLTCVGPARAQEAARRICEGDYILSHRTLLEVELERHGRVETRAIGLNDIVLSRGELSRLIKLHIAIDDTPLTRYHADGLIVATPTGSTAYSLAASGPILMPDSGVFVVTPICPHVLANRSVIVGDNATITVRPDHGETRAHLTVDGQRSIPVEAGDHIRIRKSKLQLPLAMLPELTFCEVLRQKLNWSGSAV